MFYTLLNRFIQFFLFMNQLLVETPTGPETYDLGANKAKAYEMMLSIICFMAVEAGAERPDWEEDLNSLCDGATMATNDLEADFVRAAWNDWARDYLDYGETQLRLKQQYRRNVAGKKRRVVGNREINTKSVHPEMLNAVRGDIQKLTVDPIPAEAQQQWGVGRTIWMYPAGDYRVFYVLDEETAALVIVDVSPVENIKLKVATLGEKLNVPYAGRVRRKQDA